MGLFRKKTLEKTRRETHVKLYDVVKKMDYVYEKATKENFKEYIKKLQDDFKFSVNNNIEIQNKYEKKLLNALDDIHQLLNHEIWNSRKINMKLRLIDDIKKEMLSQ